MQTKIEPAKAAGATLLTLGTAALIASIIFTSTIPAFIGLGLVFWGIILVYIQKSDYVPTAILNASVPPLADTLNQIVQTLGYNGEPVYLPPKYIENPENPKIFIPKQEGGALPTPEQIQGNEKQVIIEQPAGMLLTPPGADLTKLFEKTMTTEFTRVNLEYLKQNMSQLFIEDLEIATSFEMQVETANTSDREGYATPNAEARQNLVRVKMTTKVYHSTRGVAAQHLGLTCPLTSAIACAIAKATGRLTRIENEETSQDGTSTVVEYCLLEEEQKEQ